MSEGTRLSEMASLNRRRKQRLVRNCGRATTDASLQLLVLALFYGFACSLVHAQPDEPSATTVGETIDKEAPSSDMIKKWIEELSSNEFRVRESAAEKLAAAGASALEPLREAAGTLSDVEARGRSLRIAEAIYETSVAERTRDFLMASDENATKIFPNWKFFSSCLDSSRISRRLFVDFARKYPQLADSDFQSLEQVQRYSATVTKRLLEERWSPNGISVVDTLALQLCIIGTHQLGGAILPEADDLAVIFTAQAPFSSKLALPPTDRCLREVTGKWLNTPGRHKERRLLIALDYGEKGVPAGVELARQLLKNRDITPTEFELAIACVVRFGDASDLSLLSSWCTETRVHGVYDDPFRASMMTRDDAPKGDDILVPPLLRGEINAVQVEVLFQDIAIAAYMKLSQQGDLKEAFPYRREHPRRVFLVETLGCTEDDKEQRDKAIDLYRKISP